LPKDKKPKHMKEVLKPLLKEWRIDAATREHEVFSLWERAVGENVSKSCRPAAVHQGTLVVAVRDSAWMQELQFMKDEMIKKVNKAMGGSVIKQIIFKQGSWEEEPDREAGRIELDRSVIEEAKKAVAAIQDPKLREQVYRALLASSRRERERGEDG